MQHDWNREPSWTPPSAGPGFTQRGSVSYMMTEDREVWCGDSQAATAILKTGAWAGLMTAFRAN